MRGSPVVIVVAVAALSAPGTASAQVAPEHLQRVHAPQAWFGPAERADFVALSRVAHPRLHDGVRVLGQDLLIFERDGDVVRVLSDVEDLGEVPERTVRPDEAVAAALALHPGSSATSSSPLLVPGGDGYVPIEAVNLLTRDGLPRRVHVSGTHPVVVLRDIDPIRWDTWEGTVQVFDSSPMHGDLVIRDVDELQYEGWLVSEDRTVYDASNMGMQDEQLQYSADSEWHWDRDDWRFSIAMGFYHLQNHERFQADAGGADWFDGLDEPELAIVNITTETFEDEPTMAVRAGHASVERTDGWEHVYFFGDGNYPGYDYNNFAHAAEVWAHEQGHAITGEATPFLDADLRGIEPEFDALHEGLADYGAVVYTGDVDVLEWVGAFHPDSHRPVDEVRVFPDDFVDGADVHENGRIVSSMGWSLRQVVGAPADSIVLSSRFYLSSGDPGFEGLVEGMLAYDEDANDARYAVPLLRALDLHGLEPDSRSAPPEAVLTVDGRARLDEPLTIEADADGSALRGVSWTLLDAPPESAFTAVEGEQRWDRALTFTPDVCGVWLFEGVVSSSGHRLSAPETVEIATCGAGCACAGAPVTVDRAALPRMLLASMAVGRRRRR